MSVIDVLAQHLAAASSRTVRAWDTLSEAEQDLWRRQAEVVAGQMLEVEPAQPLNFPDAVEAFVTAAEYLNTIGIRKDLDAPEAVRLLDRIRHGIDQARYVDSNLVTHLFLHHEHGKTVYEGIGQVEVFRTRERRAWDIRGVCQAVIDKRMEERGYEAIEDPWTAVEWLLEVLPGGDPRLTPLRAMGLDPEAFHVSTPGNPTVRFPPRT